MNVLRKFVVVKIYCMLDGQNICIKLSKNTHNKVESHI